MENDKLEEIKRRVHRTDIYIKCENEKIKTRFKKLALEQFQDNYEITLRWLLDCSEGLFADKNDEINAKIEILASQQMQDREEIKKLKQSLEKPEEKKQIKMCGGMKHEQVRAD